MVPARFALTHPVVADLRRARRHNRVVEVDWIDALYRAYLTAIAAGIAVVVLSGVVGDRRLGAHAAQRAVAGVLAARRLPESPVGWVLAGAAVGGLGLPAAAGAALATSGRRVPPRVAGLLALAVLGWSAADVRLGVATSPFTLLGRLALW